MPLKTVLFAWELGGGLGHLYQFEPLARRLRARGYRLVYALRDLSQARALLGPTVAQLWQAPVWLAARRDDLAPVSYAEMLMQFGYLDSVALGGLVEGWRTIYRQVRPDLLLVSHAPTALLAARGLPGRCALLDTGFGAPPRQTPLPAMRWWQAVSAARLHHSETRVLATINNILTARGLAPLAGLAELFDVDERFLCTCAELDHYPARDAGARYWGPLFTLDAGQDPQWPAVDGPKVFVYADLPAAPMTALLEGVSNSRCCALVYAPTYTVRGKLGAHIQLVREAQNIAAVRAQCAAVICHGSGLSAAALLAARPVLLLPRHLEQYLVGQRLRQLGAGTVLLPSSDGASITAALTALLENAAYRLAAQAFAARYVSLTQAAQLDAMEARCASLLEA